jgi:hypothetical protein
VAAASAVARSYTKRARAYTTKVVRPLKTTARRTYAAVGSPSHAFTRRPSATYRM